MTAKSLDWYTRPKRPDGAIDDSERRRAGLGVYRIVTSKDEEIYWLCKVDCIQEPGLFDEVSGLDDFRDIRIACEIKQDAKCHDSQP